MFFEQDLNAFIYFFHASNSPPNLNRTPRTINKRFRFVRHQEALSHVACPSQNEEFSYFPFPSFPPSLMVEGKERIFSDSSSYCAESDRFSSQHSIRLISLTPSGLQLLSVPWTIYKHFFIIIIQIILILIIKVIKSKF
jgi:hypothetical protein